jgi:hypothetical protein
MTDAADGAAEVPASSTTDVTSASSSAPHLVLGTSGTPADATTGSSYTLDLIPSTSLSGPAAYNDLVLMATLASGETFVAAPAPAGWSCSLSGGSTVLTCTYAVSAASPVPAGTSLVPPYPCRGREAEAAVSRPASRPEPHATPGERRAPGPVAGARRLATIGTARRGRSRRAAHRWSSGGWSSGGRSSGGLAGQLLSSGSSGVARVWHRG